MGRYTNDRRRKHKILYHKIRENSSNVISTPYLFSNTDADDILMRSCNTFLNIRSVRWTKEIQNLHGEMERAIHMMEQGLFSLKDYTKILETTGFEVDNRKSFISVIENFMEVVLLNILPFAKQLPGLNDMNSSEVLCRLLSCTSLLHLALTTEMMHSFEGEYFVVNVEGKKLQMNYRGLIPLSDEEHVESLKDYHFRLVSLDLTLEEILLLFALSLVSPEKKYPQLINAQKRIHKAFTRYMQMTYQHRYLERMRSVVNTLAYMREFSMNHYKMLRKNQKYFSYVYQSPIVKTLYRVGDMEENLRSIKALKL
ncbi:unnamed protein product [Dimorphilus gyrociliatus]|uniref:Uncharacterized protein n=1 Tax=Dimorphilus gyrociliatus TaxID=2664684 RepID=A0A7I8VZG1_9ANNE|nr:unnamed protein product [Dimorphilus gyrociliatus]